jgi:hypothetical protein
MFQGKQKKVWLLTTSITGLKKPKNIAQLQNGSFPEQYGSLPLPAFGHILAKNYLFKAALEPN